MLKFIGLGLYDEKGLSILGLEEAKNSDIIFAEFYTSFMPGLSLTRLEKLIGKPIQILSRKDVEEKSEEIILKFAKERDVAFLTPGDPMNATTHVALRVKAEKMGIKTKLIHAASIFSAIAGATGLQSYKFGRSVSIPIAAGFPVSETPYNVIKINKNLGLHTLVLLDLDVEAGIYLTVPEALKQLLIVEENRRENVINLNSFIIVVARLGGAAMYVKSFLVKDALNQDFGNPPFSIVFPGKLHFMEVEALQVLTGAKIEFLKENL
ncbi:MAG: diphthine synthase [Candidatus Bathyarchaeia archaeon]|nr:diphthine synthase [Candidatus Bathyarchaeota archaeon]